MPVSRLLGQELTSAQNSPHDMFVTEPPIEDPYLRDRLGGDYRRLEVVKKDLHVRSCLERRAQAITARERLIIPASSAEADVHLANLSRWVVDNLQWDDLEKKLWEGAYLNGRSHAEILWETRDTPRSLAEPEIDKESGEVIRPAYPYETITVPYDIRPREARRFKFAPVATKRGRFIKDPSGLVNRSIKLPIQQVRGWELRYLTLTDWLHGIPAEIFKFVTHTYGSETANPNGRGVGGDLYWPVTLKKEFTAFWVVYGDKYAEPGKYGTYPEGGDPDLLEDFFEYYGRNSWAALPEGYRVQLLEAQRAGTINTYETFLRWIDGQISELVVGQAYGVSVRQGFSGQPAENDEHIRQEWVKADADLLAPTMREYVLVPLALLNIPTGEAPQYYRDFSDQENLNERSERDDRLYKQGYRLKPSAVKRIYGDDYVDQGAVEVEEETPSPGEQAADSFGEGGAGIASFATDFPTNGDDKKISLRNSQYPQFDYAYALDLRENWPNIWSKGGNIRGNSAFTNWGKARDGAETEAVLNWIKEREAWMARHYQDNRLAGVVAQVKWGGIGTLGQSGMKKLINEEKQKQSSNNQAPNQALDLWPGYEHWKQHLDREGIQRLEFAAQANTPYTALQQGIAQALDESFNQAWDLISPSLQGSSISSAQDALTEVARDNLLDEIAENLGQALDLHLGALDALGRYQAVAEYLPERLQDAPEQFLSVMQGGAEATPEATLEAAVDIPALDFAGMEGAYDYGEEIARLTLYGFLAWVERYWEDLRQQEGEAAREAEDRAAVRAATGGWLAMSSFEGSAFAEATRASFAAMTLAWGTLLAGHTAIMSARDVVKLYPFSEYEHVTATSQARRHHMVLDGMILPTDHAFWVQNSPPNGFGCNCRIRYHRELPPGRRLSDPPAKTMMLDGVPVLALSVNGALLPIVDSPDWLGMPTIDHNRKAALKSLEKRLPGWLRDLA